MPWPRHGPFRAAVERLDWALRARAPTPGSCMTLLLTHSACLDHLTPAGTSRTARPAARGRGGAGEDRFKPLLRGEAPEGTLDFVTLCHGEHYVDELRHIAPYQRHDLYRRRHLDVAGHLGSRDARRRRRGGRDRRGDVRHAPQRVRRGAAARPSRRDPTSRWASASSTTPRSPRVTPSANTASRAPRWSISTSITATAPRIFSGPIRP